MQVSSALRVALLDDARRAALARFAEPRWRTRRSSAATVRCAGASTCTRCSRIAELASARAAATSRPGRRASSAPSRRRGRSSRRRSRATRTGSPDTFEIETTRSVLPDGLDGDAALVTAIAEFPDARSADGAPQGA
jgi:hypothetical protein